MVKEISTSTEIKNFISHHKVLCVMTLGLAIVAFTAKTLCGRAVSWLKETFGTTKKVDTVATDKLNEQEKDPLSSLDRTKKFEKALDQTFQELDPGISKLIQQKMSDEVKVETEENVLTSKEPPNISEEEANEALLKKAQDLIIKNQELQKKREEATIKRGNIEALFGDMPLEKLTIDLKKLIKGDSAEFRMYINKIKNSPIQELAFNFSYNVPLDKFVVSIIGMQAPKNEDISEILKYDYQGIDNPLDILNYKVINTKTSKEFQMKQKMHLPIDSYSVVNVSSRGKLEVTEDEAQEALSEKNSSAWFLDYDTTYVIEFPESYNMSPMSFKINSDKKEADRKIYEELWLKDPKNTKENMPSHWVRLCEELRNDKVEALRFWKDKKKQAVTRGAKLEANLPGLSPESVNNKLKELIRTSFDNPPDPIQYNLAIEHPSMKEIRVRLSYSTKFDKFVVALTGIAKPESNLSVFEYTLTNKTNLHSFPMKQGMIKNQEFTSFSSVTRLSHREDMPPALKGEFVENPYGKASLKNSALLDPDLEVLSKDNDSAWLLDYDTEYTVTFPDSYNLELLTFKINS